MCRKVGTLKRLKFICVVCYTCEIKINEFFEYFCKETCLESPDSMLQLPDATNQKLCSERHNITIQFISEEWAVVADGAGKLLVLHTGDRAQNNSWKVHNL